MDQEVQQRLQAIEGKIDNVYRSAEKTRKYFLWTMIISVAVIILPLIGLLIVVPSFLSLYGGGGDIQNTLDLLHL